METGPFVDPAGARLRHAARLQRMQQLVNPTPAPAPEPAHGVDIARLATGTLGGALATSALMRLIPHPAAQVAGAAIPLAARVLPHAANLVGSIAGFAGAPALVDAVAPGLHDTVNKNLGTVGGAAAVALPLAMLAMRRGRGVTPVGGGAPVTPAGPALPGVGGPVPVGPAGPVGTAIIPSIQKIHPVPMEPRPTVPGPDLLTSLGVRGHLMGPAPHVPEVAPVPAAAVPVPISGHLAGPVRMPEIRNPLSGFATQATHLAPAPVPVDPVVRGHLPSPTLESRFGIPAEYDAILPAHISQMSPGQLSSIALQNNSRSLQNMAGIVDANLASRSPGQLALSPFKKKIENSPELANPPAVVAEPTATAPQIVRLSRRGPAEPTIRMPEIQDAIRRHGLESAAMEFNREARAARQPLLSPDEMRYLEVAAQKMAQSPAQHARVRSTTIKPNPEVEVPQLVDPENVAPVRQVFQGLQQERFEKLAQGIDRQLRAEQDPKRRLKIAKTAMIGEPRDVKDALRQHLEQIAPDVHGRLMKKSQLPAVQEPELPNVVADLASGELEDQLPGSTAGDQVLSPPPIGPVEFIPHRVARDGGFETVMADAGKLEDQWSQNPQNYLPKELPAEGEGATRFQKVNEFLKSGNAVEQPHVVVDAQGKLALDDGRHRARLLMNEGQPQIPLTVPTEDAAKVNSLVGASPAMSGPVGVPEQVSPQQLGYATVNPGDLQPHQPIQVSEQKGVSNAAGHVGEQIVGGDELQNGAGGGQATEAGPSDRAVGAGPGAGQAENHSPVAKTPAAEELNSQTPKVVPSLDPHTFDYGVQRSMMDRNGRAEHGGISTKVVPHPAGGFGVEVNTPHPTQQGVSREGMPESYPTIEEAQSAAIKELAKRVGAKPERGAEASVAQAEPVKTEVATAEIPPYKRETPSAAENAVGRKERDERLAYVNNREREALASHRQASEKLRSIPRNHKNIRREWESKTEHFEGELAKLREEQRALEATIEKLAPKATDVKSSGKVMSEGDSESGMTKSAQAKKANLANHSPEKIDYSPDMKITNMDQLPRGTGAGYLVVVKSPDGEKYIAKEWRRSEPVRGTKDEMVIRFPEAKAREADARQQSAEYLAESGKSAPAIEKLAPKAVPEPEPKPQIEKLTAKAGPIVNPYGDSPAGKAYVAAKTQAPESMVLLRNGDFYELFGDDAVKASKDVGLTLTHLDKNSKNPIPMAGFPYHHLEGYLQKLVRSGHRVAIAEAK